MLKDGSAVKDVERLAADAIRALLQEIPVVTLHSLEIESPLRDKQVDMLASGDVAGERHLLVCETKQSGQPRFIRDAIYQLRNYSALLRKNSKASP
jgi:hypothetical protein